MYETKRNMPKYSELEVKWKHFPLEQHSINVCYHLFHAPKHTVLNFKKQLQAEPVLLLRASFLLSWCFSPFPPPLNTPLSLLLISVSM